MAGTLVSKIGPIGFSETFIAIHARRLPGEVALHEGIPPKDSRIYEGLMRRAGWQHFSRGGRRYWLGVLRKIDPDVVLAEHGPTAVSMLGACRRAKIPLVAHFHGSDAWMDLAVAGHRWSYRRLFEYAAALVVPSAVTAGRLRSIGAPGDRLHVIPGGVDTIAIRPSSPATAPPRFVAVGRFVESKGHEFTVRAFADFHHTRPDTRLTIVGDGPLLTRCKAVASELGVRQAVEFPGSLAHKQVTTLLQNARAFVHHAVTAVDGSREALGMAVAEAQAAGLPVVATRCGGIPEMVSDGSTGLLVPERDVKATASAMLSLVDHPQLAARLGEAGRRRVEREQSVASSIAALTRVLEEVRRSV